MSHADRMVAVPQLVGVAVPAAIAFAFEVYGLHLAPAVETETPLSALTSIWEIASQSPAPGALVERGSVVVVEVRRRGGESGDREPREPRPPAGTLAVELEEPDAEAVD